MAMICFSSDFARGFLVELSIFGLRNFVTCFAHFWWGSIKIAMKVPLYGYFKKYKQTNDFEKCKGTKLRRNWQVNPAINLNYQTDMKNDREKQ